MGDKDVYAAWSRRAHTPPPPEDKWENQTIWTVRARNFQMFRGKLWDYLFEELFDAFSCLPDILFKPNSVLDFFYAWLAFIYTS